MSKDKSGRGACPRPLDKRGQATLPDLFLLALFIFLCAFAPLREKTSLLKLRPLLDPSFVPQTQIQERPKMKSPIFRTAPMFIQHAADEVVVQ
jgi:hypothetical protein